MSAEFRVLSAEGDAMSLFTYMFIERRKGMFSQFARIEVDRATLNSEFRYQFGHYGWDSEYYEIPPLFLPRGLPENVSQDVLFEYADPINDELASKYPESGCVTRQQAEKWVQAGTSQYLKDDKAFVSNPDFYCASWLTASELEQLCNKVQEETGEDNILFRSIIAMMNVLNQGNDTQTRIVFWFS